MNKFSNNILSWFKNEDINKADVFISYSHRNQDGIEYAENLRNRLRVNKDDLTKFYDIFIDTRSGNAQRTQPDIIDEIARNSGMMVIVGAKEAFESKTVKREINAFHSKNKNKPLKVIYPKSFSTDITNAVWIEQINERTNSLLEKENNFFDERLPSDEIIGEIFDSFMFPTQQELLKTSEEKIKQRGAAALVFTIIAIISGIFAFMFAGKVAVANQKLEQVDQNLQQANAKVVQLTELADIKEKEADEATIRAKNETDRANSQTDRANSEFDRANAQSNLANMKTIEANKATKLADKETTRANKATELAEQKTNEANAATLKAATESETAQGNANISNSITNRLNGNAYQSLNAAIEGFKILKKNKRDLTVTTDAIRGGLVVNSFRLSQEEKNLTDVIATSISQDTAKIVVYKKTNSIEILASEDLSKITSIPFSASMFVEEISIDNSANVIAVKLRNDSEEPQIWLLDRRKSNIEWTKLPLESLKSQSLKIKTFAMSSNGKKLAVVIESDANPRYPRPLGGIRIYDTDAFDKYSELYKFNNTKVLSIAFSPDGEKIAALTKSEAFFSTNSLRVIKWSQNPINAGNYDLLNAITIKYEYLFGDSFRKVILNNSGQFILFGNMAGKFFENDDGIPSSTLTQINYRTISASFLNNRDIISLDKQCFSNCSKEEEDLSRIDFAPFFLRKWQVSDLDLSVTNNKEIRLRTNIESLDINSDDFNKTGIIYLNVKTKREEQILEWQPCQALTKENVFPCESNTDLKISNKQVSQAIKPQGRLESDGSNLYVYTPSGKKFLLQYKFLDDYKSIENAELTFSPNEEALIINHSNVNYYFLRENNLFINKRVSSDIAENKLTVNNNGLVAVFRDESTLSPRGTSSLKRLSVWDMKLFSFGFSQPIENNLKVLRFSQDGKFLIGISYDLLAQSGGVNNRPSVYQLKMYLWLADPDSLLKLAEYRLGRAY